MSQIQKSRRTGRKRWTELVRFFTKAMTESRNERVRMAAAMRLADILTLREQRELAELKAAERKAAGADPGDTPEGATASAGPGNAQVPSETVDAFLERVKAIRGHSEVSNAQ